MGVQSLGQEDPLEEGTATHSSMLAWRRPWAEEPGGLQSVGSQSRTRLKRLSVRAHTHAHTHTHTTTVQGHQVYLQLYKQHRHPSLGLSHLPELKRCT